MLREVVTSYEATMGTDHELTAINRNNLSQMELELGERDVARALAEKSLRGLESGFGGAGHPGIGASLVVLAQVAELEGDLEAARLHYARAHEVFVKTRGGDAHPNAIDTATSLAAVLRELGRAEDAVALARRAVASANELDPSHPRNMAPRLELVAALSAAGDEDAARATADALREFVREHDIVLDSADRAAMAALPVANEGTVVVERQRR